MHLEKIHLERIRKFISRIKSAVYTDTHDLNAQYCYDQEQPIPLQELEGKELKEIGKSEIWGRTWGSAWFKFSGTVPQSLEGKEVGALIDLDSEACVWKDGAPWLGLTNKEDWFHNATKRYVPLFDSAQTGQEVELQVEAAANDLFGAGKTEYKLVEASLVHYHADLFKLVLDMELLLNLAEHLPEKTVRRQRILYGLNQICNLWQEGKGMPAAQEITSQLLSQPATASALTAYSVGHAHIDLAWLWPVRETIRKGGRTFATALRMLERYPEYVFGASQAQLYKWTKVRYPKLYEQIQCVVKQKRWEIQGAGWVEFDTNLISGESMIRQMLYGKRFFEREFGVSPKVLWLPDCFGFSGNLPQIMQGCGVQFFMTQKLSWNESDTFPHSLFRWQGIDGSTVLAHQLPTNDYNFSNTPQAFLQTEQRFAQSEVCDGFLNLYGIGDGGGGPGAEHIEYGLRQQNLEGVSKVKFCASSEFFDHLQTYDAQQFPLWTGELYLQFHRGTYTTQALMKKHNRHSEHLMQLAELLFAICSEAYPEQLSRIWEDILLLQFHDIIPGSSIGWVYKDAHALSKQSHHKLQELIEGKLTELAVNANDNKAIMVFNPLCWDRTAWITLPGCASEQRMLVQVPAMGYTVVTAPATEPPARLPYTGIMENELLKVTLSERGTILSMYDKQAGRELLEGESNLLQLWEDEPNNWAAWDINHFYRDTFPVQAVEVEPVHCESFIIPGSHAKAVFNLKIGNSRLTQTIELRAGERLLRFAHFVDWHEHRKMLRVHFHSKIKASSASYEIQFGIIKRPTHHNTSWEKALFEVPAHRFADLSEPDYGLALINDCKYGYRIVESELELNLLRSPADVDPEADLHSHSYSYALYPHPGCLEASDTLQVAHAFNSPLQVFTAPEAMTGKSASYFCIQGGSVKLETVKPAEEGTGTILRLYEYAGTKTEAQLMIRQQITQARLCNMLEQVISDASPLEVVQEGEAGMLKLSFKPFEIKTILLS